MAVALSSSTPGLTPGHRLDRYELVYPLAQGGMATVWVARLTGKHGFEKLVAIKTILPQYADDPEFQTMFLDEARLASRIRHPNVAEIMDLGEDNGTLFLVMEWIDGDSLARLYNAIIKAGGRFPVPVLTRLSADCCAGLHAAHELRDERGQLLGAVHRDVSPQNILIGVSGVTKVIDFGVAKAAGRMSQETSAGLVKGKIQYASPEQAMGKNVDRRSDIWGLGTVMYQVLAGRLPYEGENQLATLHLLTSGKPPKPLPPSVPAPLAAIVRKALAFRPEDRYATALEMQQALETCLPQLPGQADVAATVQQFLGDRAESRKREVAEAMAAVSSRSNPGTPSIRASVPDSTSNPGLGAPRSGVVAVTPVPGMPPAAPFSAPPMPPPSLGVPPFGAMPPAPSFNDPAQALPPPQPIAQVSTSVSEGAANKLQTRHLIMGAGALLTTAAIWTGVAVFALQSKAHAGGKNDKTDSATSAAAAATSAPARTAEPSAPTTTAATTASAASATPPATATTAAATATVETPPVDTTPPATAVVKPVAPTGKTPPVAAVPPSTAKTPAGPTKVVPSTGGTKKKKKVDDGF